MIKAGIALLGPVGMLLADAISLPSPTGDDFIKWLSSACLVMGIIALAKLTFAKRPADHERFADRKETRERLDNIEKRIGALDDKLDDVPGRTIALLSDAGRILRRPANGGAR